MRRSPEAFAPCLMRLADRGDDGSRFGMIDLAIHPLTWGWALMLFAGVRAGRKRDRAGAWVAFGAAALLTVFGGTPLPHYLLTALERPYASAALTPPTGVDALVMLGGCHSASPFEPHGLDASDAFDRALATLHWARAGVTTNLAIGGGQSLKGAGQPSDGEALERFLRPLVPAGCSVVALPPSLTTRDECRHFLALATDRRWHRIALVTSAVHLRRAERLFRSAGFEVVPVACDFTGLAGVDQVRLWSVVPRASTLEATHTALHEIVGGWWYALRSPPRVP